MEIAKEVVSTLANGKNYIVGEEVKYQIAVTNVGRITVSGIKIDNVLTAVNSKGNDKGS